MIGRGAIVLNGADIGEYALVGAGALVTERQVIPPKDLYRIKRTADRYAEKGYQYANP